jgi:hypothetical protein
MCSYNGLKNIQPTNVHRENLIKFILTQYNKTSLLKRKEKEGSDKQKSIFFILIEYSWVSTNALLYNEKLSMSQSDF